MGIKDWGEQLAGSVREYVLQDIPILPKSYLVNKSGTLAPKDASLVPESMFWKMSLDLNMPWFFLRTKRMF